MTIALPSDYSVYSMAILWNMNAHDLNVDARHFAFKAVPVDGDAPARSRALQLKNSAAWAKLRREGLELLRGTHNESDKVDAR